MAHTAGEHLVLKFKKNWNFLVLGLKVLAKKSEKVTFWTLKACLKSILQPLPPDLLIPSIKVRCIKAARTLIPGTKSEVTEKKAKKGKKINK